MGIDQLLGGVPREQLAVERAIAEFRAGRPVLVEGAAGDLLAAPVEGLDARGAVALQGLAGSSARLVLAGPRLHRLGALDRAHAAIALPAIDLQRIAKLVLDDGAALDADLLTLAPGEEMGLRLAHLAALLPALVVVPLDRGALADAPVVRVPVAAISAYPAQRVAGLHIVSRATVPLEGAPDSEFVIFRGGEGLRDHAAVIVGRPDLSQPVAVRLHSACLTGDLFGSLKCDCGDQLRMTARHMSESGGGIILYLDQEGRGNGLASKIKAYRLQADGLDTYDADEALGFDHDQRGFAFAADMLKQLGVSRVKILTNNPVKIAALEAAGLEVVAQQRVHGRPTPQNVGYLAAKRDRAGHSIDAELEAPAATGRP